MIELLLAAGMGVLVAIGLCLVLAFNMVRYRWVMDHRIHPLLEREGLRRPDDGFVSSGVRERMEEFHRAERAAASAPDPSVAEREARERRRMVVFDPRFDVSPLPAGPYPFDRPMARWARDIYEGGDWKYADGWLRGVRSTPRVVRGLRLDAWRNEVLARYGLSVVSPVVLRRVERVARRERLWRGAGPARAYIIACEKTAKTVKPHQSVYRSL
ncbi:hypothetical protein JS530_03090 [Bifidobacterium sp. LC6]|uniref:Uncharacterized protein n=1 Tax=Bifidobacterium colobi TaxID=2809026 RepID=A0ABS5UUS2_9BIFI|nr:hypothetical protein [Bifidobacterium colobi]MBT1174503.1 hypothetical protein [Bifidobacterium colobi]